ncbi:hypothetical protein HDU97_002116 [Phlyctochytrium planicorne]|nr:hypothetical protein HDU97_002116 [Phlyctochytrium planicorne]
MQTDASWDRIDKPSFYSWSALLFLGVRATVYPIALVKTRLQVAEEQKSFRTFKTFTTILRREGFRALYQGFAVTAVGAIPAQVLYLSAFEASKHYLHKALTAKALRSKLDENRIAVLTNFVGGGIASLSSQIVVIPIDVVSQKLMVQNKKKLVDGAEKPYKNGIDAIVRIFSSEGIGGFYRGSLPSILTYVPSSAVWWGTFALTRRVIVSALNLPPSSPSSSHHHSSLPPLSESYIQPKSYPIVSSEFRDLVISGVSGFIAGGVAAAVTNPMDVVKTRLQTMPEAKGEGLIQGFRMLWRSEGWTGFTRGMGARVMQMAPVSVMTISTYEIVKYLSVKDP